MIETAISQGSLLQASTPSAFAERVISLAIVSLVSIVVIITMLSMLASGSGSQNHDRSITKAVTAGLYRRLIRPFADRKQYHYSTFGSAHFTTRAEAEIGHCVHCDDGGIGYESRFGTHWIAFGFVVLQRAEGTIYACQSCETAPIGQKPWRRE